MLNNMESDVDAIGEADVVGVGIGQRFLRHKSHIDLDTGFH